LMKEMRVARKALEAYFVISEIHDEDRVLGADERGVELLHDLRRAGVIDAQDDTIGLHEVLDGLPLLEELRVGDQGYLMSRKGGHGCLKLACRSYRDGALRDDDLVAIDGLSDAGRDPRDRAHVHGPIGLWGSPHGDEDQ
jgi:hypothetical protein